MAEVEHPEQNRLGGLNTHGKVVDTFQAAAGVFPELPQSQIGAWRLYC